jgi:putative endonuclease
LSKGEIIALVKRQKNQFWREHRCLDNSEIRETLNTEKIDQQPREHFVYIVQCIDGTLYTGYAKNVAQRVAMHNAGKGAKYTQSRRPVSLQASWSFQSKGEALRAEHAIKRLSRAQKLRLCGREAERAG